MLIIEKLNEFLKNRRLVITLIVVFGLVVCGYIALGQLVGSGEAETDKIEYEESEYDLSGGEDEIVTEDGTIAKFGDELTSKSASDYEKLSASGWKSEDGYFIVFHPEDLRAHQYKYNVTSPKTEQDVTNYGYYDVMLVQNIMALAGDDGGHIESEYTLNGDTLTYNSKTYKAVSLDSLVYFSFDMYGVGFGD